MPHPAGLVILHGLNQFVPGVHDKGPVPCNRLANRLAAHHEHGGVLFGFEQHSLACLRDYPFDTIKIDRSFVSDLASSRDVLAVIHATVTLVGNLGMASVAEGVETAAQVAILKQLGCRYAQGYYFSRPVAAENLLEVLADRDDTSTRPVPVFAR